MSHTIGELYLRNYGLRECQTERFSVKDSALRYSPINVLLDIFTMRHLPDILFMTTERLHEVGKTRKTSYEIIKFLGALAPTKKFEFSRRNELWKTTK